MSATRKVITSRAAGCFLLAAHPYVLTRTPCELALPRVPAKDHARCEQMSRRLALKLAEGPIVQGKRPAIRP